MDLLDSMLARGAPDNAISGLDADFAAKLMRFAQAAPAPLTIQSGYRSPERQARLWQQALEKYGSPEAARKWVAPPGRSKHNEGMAADLGYGAPGLGKGDESLIQWAHANAADYGLTFPLPNENWHIEPIGARGTRAPIDGAGTGLAASAPGASAGGSTISGAPADTHSLASIMASNNPIERQGMLAGLQDYSMNQFLADAFSGQNPLRRAFYGELSRILA